ncbi:MAG TPA: SIS domain-containing protein [Rhizomicrobium sp.]|jgi:glucosamine--fructose-6-phosphate aminotransferase (isomerizing)
MADSDAPAREPSEQQTRMFREAAEAPDAVARQLSKNHALVARIATKLRGKKPRAVVTGARGSSDHAATFAKYLIETRLGVITSSIGLSIGSVYEAQADFRDTLFLAVSQSGKSPDLLASVEKAKSGGAFVVALVNNDQSPLASLAHDTVPLLAGPEKSVAATKTYLTSVAAIAALVATWAGDDDLSAALAKLPEQMQAAWRMDWSEAVMRLTPARDLYTIGRGLGFGCAQEAALKLKETCGLHAEAFSSAEVHHGPMALVKSGFPVLLLSQNDETRAGMTELADSVIRTGANLLVAGFEAPGALKLPTVSAHPAIEPILMAQSFYRMVNALALARGLNPDHPPNLNKITETI